MRSCPSFVIVTADRSIPVYISAARREKGFGRKGDNGTAAGELELERGLSGRRVAPIASSELTVFPQN